jgi:diaminobutyrate-2-oxoglutarate transaminase
MDELRSLSFEDAPNIVVTPPGPKAKALLEEQKEIESSATIRYPLTMPLAIDEGKGATVKDVDGNVYIDFFAGIAVLPVGYSNPYVLEAVERQQKKLIHALDFPNVPRANLVKK